MIDFNLLPTLTDFSELKFGDKVYSKRFGLGIFLRLHDNEAVVEFFDRRIRIVPDDYDISLVSKNTRKRGRNVMSGEVNGEKVSFTKMKKMMTQNIAENFISNKIVLDVLGIKQKQYISLCESNNIEINKFGIKRDDLVKLNKIINSELK